jgi:hypothetical protein
MPQTTRTSPKPRQLRGRGTQTPPQRRFGRPGAPVTRSAGRRTAPRNATGFGRLPGRAKPKAKQQSGIRGALTGLLSKSGGSSRGNGPGKGKAAGGLAAVAAAAGVAFRNRDKLTSMLGRGGQQQQHSAPGAPHSDV